MRVIHALTGTTEALVTGIPDQQRRPQREQQAAQIAHAIINLYWTFGGDPSVAPTVHHYYVTQDGTPIMLEPADPPSLAELEKRRAAREQRRADQEAAAKERRRRLRAAR